MPPIHAAAPMSDTPRSHPRRNTSRAARQFRIRYVHRRTRHTPAFRSQPVRTDRKDNIRSTILREPDTPSAFGVIELLTTTSLARRPLVIVGGILDVDRYGPYSTRPPNSAAHNRTRCSSACTSRAATRSRSPTPSTRYRPACGKIPRTNPAPIATGISAITADTRPSRAVEAAKRGQDQHGAGSDTGAAGQG